MIPKKWTIRPADPSLVHEMADRLKISAPVAQILVARGFETPEAAYAFLNPGRARLHDPFFFKDMQPAVERLAQARDAKEKVLIYGDYDVDGITATSLLFQTMAGLGFDLDYFIPNRFEEGYGLNPKPLKRAKEAGFSLVVTVDCGSKEVEAAQFARDLGLDLVVTDHHIPDASTSPPAVAFLNPMRPDGGYPDKNLCGAAVAFKLAQGLTQHLGGDPAELDRHLDLVAMGTVADVAPLVGENRSLVRLGLQRLRQTDRPGIRALLDATRVVQQKIGVRQIGFQLAPRINALGRLGKAAGAVRLLVTDKDEEAVEIAEIMNEANSERQRLQEKVVSDLRKIANAEPDRFTAPVIVLSHPQWHRGVIGIAASKAVDWHYRPAILFNIEDGVAHGSARSIPGIDITRALEKCSDLLERFGGHELAAGVTVQADRLPALRKRLEKVVAEMEEGQDLEPHLEIDAEVRLDEMNESLVNQLTDMGPFGTGNPRPVLVAHDVAAGDTARIVGNGSLKMMVAQGNNLIDAIAFGQSGKLGSVDLNHLDLAFHPEINEWRGQRSLQLNIVDLRTYHIPTPVAHWTDKTDDQSPDLSGVRKIVAETWPCGIKRLGENDFEGEILIALDEEKLHQEVMSNLGSEQYRVAPLDPTQWNTPSAPDTIIFAPGRKNPRLIRQYLLQVRSAYPQAELHLLCVSGELEEMQQTLIDLYPDRDQLLAVYQRMKENLNQDYFEIDDVALVLKDITRSHLTTCIKIFEELDLLTRHSDQVRMMFKRVRARRDILMSPSFRQGQSLRAEWTAWIEALQGPDDQLLQFLCGKQIGIPV